ncbi:MAG: hypothetical protein U5R48_09445 [Gammaproteobacteria bacterium]|nr:hypothetical protein [Gammaproteobacteria bacterium]
MAVIDDNARVTSIRKRSRPAFWPINPGLGVRRRNHEGMNTRRERLNYRTIWLAAGWLMVAVVVYLSLSPSAPRGPDFPDSDKLMHALTYLVLVAWFGQLYPSSPGRAAAVLGFAAMGAGLEVLQGMGGIRQASWLDGFANLGGALCGWLCLRTRLAMSLAWVERWVLALGSSGARTGERDD